jgi:hypothetical protein
MGRAGLGEAVGVADRGVLALTASIQMADQPSSTLARRQTAIPNASRTSSVRMLVAARQPTINREKTSMTKATKTVPDQLAT